MGKTIKNVGAAVNRQHFSKEFKLEAVRLLELGQKPATQIALELGIPRHRLYKWQTDLNKAGKEQAFPGTGRKPAEERRDQSSLTLSIHFEWPDHADLNLHVQ